MGGGFPIDLILFGMIAVFLVLRLRGILGRRTGFERQVPEQNARGPVPVPGMNRPPGPTIDARAEPAGPERPLPEPGGPVAATLQRMNGIDGGFSARHFLSGAEGAFRIIVEAFGRGDRAALRPLLNDPTFASFDGAVSAREAAGETQRTELKGIERAEIVGAELDGGTGRITVRFTSDQVSETVDRNGRTVAGTDAVTEITDVWTFERDLRSPDPAWRLVAARSG